MNRYDRAAHTITHQAASFRAVAVFGLAVVGWLAWGAVAGFPRPWELTGTCGVPIVTFFMVAILQHAQNRDAKATHLKLNELLLSLEEPDEEVVLARTLPDSELDDLQRKHHEGVERR